MWIALNDSFLSIVSKDCARDELLVRARRKGDIEKIFPGAKVTRSAKTDYAFRAVVKRSEVEAAMVGEVRRINYPNFKDSVAERPLHDAYLRVWTELAKLQPTRPYSGLGSTFGSFRMGDLVTDDRGVVGEIIAVGGAKKKRGRKAKKLRRGQ